MAYPLPEPILYLVKGMAVGSVIVLAMHVLLHLIDRYRQAPPPRPLIEEE